MDRKNTFTAIAVLCLLGLIASLITVPAGDSQAWPWHRSTVILDDGGQAAPTAPSNRLIPLTKRTIANAERITEAVKAAISAAGKVIDRTEVAGEQPEAAKTAIAEAVQAAAPPAQIPESADLPIPEANTDTGGPTTTTTPIPLECLGHCSILCAYFTEPGWVVNDEGDYCRTNREALPGETGLVCSHCSVEPPYPCDISHWGQVIRRRCCDTPPCDEDWTG